TRHPQPAAASLPDVTVVADPPGAGTQPVVIDCTGRPARGLAMVAPGGFLGLLGTPTDEPELSFAAVHRSGIAVAGMHEMAGHCDELRRATFHAVLSWVAATVDPDAADGWFTTVSGQGAVAFYAAMAGTSRPSSPFAILEWS